ncbi:hypothetical protein EON76_04600 [bacterium]|nr:MAG: hypothetical protein EON76_04600 [bacterium]
MVNHERPVVVPALVDNVEVSVESFEIEDTRQGHVYSIEPGLVITPGQFDDEEIDTIEAFSVSPIHSEPTYIEAVYSTVILADILDKQELDEMIEDGKSEYARQVARRCELRRRFNPVLARTACSIIDLDR